MMAPDMHFNRLQDSVHPVPNSGLDGKYQSVSLSRKVLLIIGGVFIAVLLLSILITYLVTKGAYQQPTAAKEIADTTQRFSSQPSPSVATPTKAGEEEGPAPPPIVPVPTNNSEQNNVTTPQLPNEPTAAELRLPRSLLPISYNLKLRVHLPGYGAQIAADKNFTFDGDVTIRLNCTEATEKIVLNALKLTLANDSETLATFYQLKRKNDAEAKTISVQSAVVNETVQMVTFTLSEPLTAGEEYDFTIRYRGPISGDTLSGLYQSKYQTPERTVK